MTDWPVTLLCVVGLVGVLALLVFGYAAMVVGAAYEDANRQADDDDGY